MDNRQLKLILKLQDEASKELRKVSGNLGGVTKETGKASRGFGTMAKSIAGMAAAYVSFRTIYSAFSIGINVAADLETAEIGLATLLRDTEAAAKTVERLKTEAKRTPFELPGLTKATQLLTAVTKDGDKSINILLDVGEALAAMGKGQAELDRIIVNLQQIGAVGKASMIDIKQFAFAGIPIYEMLTDVTGKSGEALSELISSGGVTFDLITKMFDEANDAGGRFFGAFENQSGTFRVAQSNMTDSVQIFLAEFAKNSGLMDFLTESMQNISTAVDNLGTSMQSTGDTGGSFFTSLEEQTGLVTAMQEAWNGIVDTYNSALAPALADLQEALIPLQPLLDAMVQVFGGFLVVALKGAIMAVQGWIMIAAELMTGLVKINTFMVNVWVGTIDVISDRIVALTDFVKNLIDKFRSAISLAKEIGGGAIDFVSRILPGRATGGPVMGGNAHIVGERGPELFVPSTGGSIVPNNRLGSMTGGGGINITINGDVTGEDAMERLGEVIMQKVNQRIRMA